MFTKSNVWGAVAGALVLFFGGWIYYDMLAANFYAGHYAQGAVGLMKSANLHNMLIIAVACLVQTFVMSSMYSKLAEKSNGFYYGACFGFFIGFGTSLLQYGIIHTIDKTGFLVDAVWSIIFYGIIGWVIAAVHKKLAA